MTQLDLLEPRTKVPEKGGQLYELLCAMQMGKRLTVAIALMDHSVYALSQRIGDLKKMGWPIKDRWVTTAGGASVKEYWLER